MQELSNLLSGVPANVTYAAYTGILGSDTDGESRVGDIPRIWIADGIQMCSRTLMSFSIVLAEPLKPTTNCPATPTSPM